jgi:hypothetical protein
MTSNINVSRTSMHPQTSTLNLQSIYCQDMAANTITIVTHNCKTKRKDEEKNKKFSNILPYP